MEVTITMSMFNENFHKSVTANVPVQPAPTPTVVASSLENGAFSDLYWINGTIAIDTNGVIAKVKQFKALNLSYQFVDLGSLATNGTLDRSNVAPNQDINAYTPSLLQNWIDTTKATDPNQKLIGTLNYKFWRVANRPAGFNLTTFINNIDAEIKTVLDMGMHGIHFDLEHFNLNDPDLITLMQYVRSHSLQGNKYVSMSVPADPNWLSTSYVAQLGGLIDYMNPMIYDTSSFNTTAAMYTDYVRQSVMFYSSALAGTNCKLQPSVPSYAETTDHVIATENMQTAVQGIVNAISQGAKVCGLGIYWCPTFIGNYPAQLAADKYMKDQIDWLTGWVYK